MHKSHTQQGDLIAFAPLLLKSILIDSSFLVNSRTAYALSI